MAWGPDSTQDRYGDEIAVYYAAVCDDEGEPVGKVYTCRSRSKAIEIASNMSADRRIPLEIDA